MTAPDLYKLSALAGALAAEPSVGENFGAELRSVAMFARARAHQQEKENWEACQRFRAQQKAGSLHFPHAR